MNTITSSPIGIPHIIRNSSQLLFAFILNAMHNNNPQDDSVADLGQGPREDVMKIILITPHTGRNLGDAAIQDAAIENIKLRHPAARISGITLQPEVTAELHSIPCFPLTSAQIGQYGAARVKKPANRTAERRQRFPLTNRHIRGLLRVTLFLPKLALRILLFAKNEVRHIFEGYDFMKGADLAVFSGGGQLDDHWGGPWHHPYTILKWSVLARIAGADLIFLSVGADHLDSPLTRFFVRRALLLAQYRSYRDDETRERMASLGIPDGDHVYPDLAYGLPSVKYLNRQADGNETGLVVGLSPISASARASRNSRNPDNYIGNLVALTSWLLSQNHTVLLFPSQISSDPPVITEIRSRLEAGELRYDSHRLISEPVRDVRDLLDQISQTDIVVASRFHSVLLAHVLSRPVLALSYRSKVKNLMTAMDLNYFCLDINDLSLDVLQARLRSLMESRSAVSAQISGRVAEYRELLDRQYDSVFGKMASPVERSQLLRV